MLNEIAKSQEKERFNIIDALTIVYLDIQNHGVDMKAGFADG